MVNNEVALYVTVVELREIRTWLRAAIMTQPTDTPRFATLLHLLTKAERLLSTWRD